MHFCSLKMEFVGLGYKICGGYLYTYNFKTFELYRCNKCGKLIYKKKELHRDTYSSSFDKKIKYAEKCGYKPLGELIDTLNK